MLYGVDYYPELWPRAQWPRDLDLMAAAGLNVVRVGDLCWATMEPAPGRYTFEWLDTVLALLEERGMSAVLATPTAAVPPWLVQEDPTVMPVDAQGRRTAYGSWGAHCLSSPSLRERTRGIVRAMAGRYGHHPAVAGWQIDNELNVHGVPCHCERCAAAFQAWLRERYGTLDALNAAWGTACWSHIYSAWDQIPAPLETLAVYVHNPGLRLDFRRFASDQAIGYYRLQAEIIRALASGRAVTHNIPGRSLALDFQRLAREMDVVSWDNYPVWAEDPQVGPALTHDLVRGLRRQSFWILEQQVGTMDRPPYRATRPGLLRLWAMQAVARGAQAVLWFLWQTYRSGAEQYIAGLLDHVGRTTRFYSEMAETVRELRQVEPLLEGTAPRADVALLISYESLWALGLQSQSTHEHGAWSYVAECYAPLYRRNVAVDVLGYDADLGGYRLIVAPAPYLADAALAARLDAYVAGGGVLLVTVRAGSKTPANLWPQEPLPGPLRSLLGVTVREWDALAPGAENRVTLELPGGTDRTCRVDTWCEILDPDDATPVARYLDDFYAGEVAATHRAHGQGEVVYAGARGADLLDGLLEGLLARAGVRPVLTTPPGVEAAVRIGTQHTLLFLLNHTEREQMVELPAGCADPLTGRELSGLVALLPLDVRIVVQRGAPP
jgi:beta-galactosidase